MLLKVLLFSIISSTAIAGGIEFAPEGPKLNEVQDMREKFDPVINAMKGIVGVGTSACDEESGVAFFEMAEAERSVAKFVHCISVMTGSLEAKDALDVLYPVGSQFEGIFIHHRFTGPINPQPAVTDAVSQSQPLASAGTISDSVTENSPAVSPALSPDTTSGE